MKNKKLESIITKHPYIFTEIAKTFNIRKIKECLKFIDDNEDMFLIVLDNRDLKNKEYIKSLIHRMNNIYVNIYTYKKTNIIKRIINKFKKLLNRYITKT